MNRSILSGGGGGGSSSGPVDVTDRAARLVGHVNVDNLPATQPVSLAAAVDVSDRAARLVGHVNVDNFPATQPVSLAAAVDVSDRAARLVGHVTVDNLPSLGGVVLGVYSCTFAQLTVAAAAGAFGTLSFPSVALQAAPGISAARIRRIIISSQHSSALATPTAPRIICNRLAFSSFGSNAPTIKAAAKISSSFPAPKLQMVIGWVGTAPTVTDAGMVGHAPIVGALTAVGAYAPISFDLLDPLEIDERLIIQASEGLSFWQDVAGTTSDTRKWNLTIVWDELQ